MVRQQATTPYGHQTLCGGTETTPWKEIAVVSHYVPTISSLHISLENKEGHCSYLAQWKICIAFLTMEDICWTVCRCVR